MSETSEVLTERRDAVFVITMNRPDQRNAVNGAVAEGIGRALDQLDADPDLKVGVLTGVGKGFSAGMDLKAFATGQRPWYADRGFAGIAQRSSVKPLIAAVEGFALAGGLELALGCDLIVAAAGVKLGVPEVKVGLFAAGGGVLRLPSRVGYSKAMEMAITGDPITAEEAAELGLVARLAERGGAVAEAMLLAERVAENAPLAVAASKLLVKATQGMTETEFWAHQKPHHSAVFASNDAKEGPRAFAEKRTPQWTGT
jgi:enoyl-CoA hydratase